MVAIMVAKSALRGYLLEEALARLLRSSGYRLLTNAKQDRFELITEGGTLRVRGRGATHQVDVLGELAWTPAFSLPVRLFLEAKFSTRVGIEAVRNAHGVIHDINENFAVTADMPPRRRYRYTYCLFSTKGFAPSAANYALAHQISLVDLSGEAFLWLRQAITMAAEGLVSSAKAHGLTKFPVVWMRSTVRGLLGTAGPFDEVAYLDDVPSEFEDRSEAILRKFAQTLDRHLEFDLLLGFPAAPFIVALAIKDRTRFLTYASEYPDHLVHLKRVGQSGRPVWLAQPAEGAGAYTLTFTLPAEIEAYIARHDDQRRERTLGVKGDFLSTITVYHGGDSGLQIFQLRYEPDSFRSG